MIYESFETQHSPWRFLKLARDPEDPALAPKMLTTPAVYAELYGWDEVLKKPHQIIICVGEFDRLVLEGRGFIAVTSTVGAGVFRAEWAKEFEPIPEVYVCYDNDAAGRRGAERGCLLTRTPSGWSCLQKSGRAEGPQGKEFALDARSA